MRGVLPQISQILTDVPPGGAAVSAAPTKQRCTAHRTHLGGYGIPAIPTPPAMIVFSHRWHRCTQMFRLRSIVPRNTQNTQKFSSARKFCEFCGSTFQQEVSVCSVNSVGRCNGCSVGAAETAAPPGWVRVAALNNPPTDGTDAHRCLGCVVLFHGTRRIHRSLLLWEDAVAALLVHFLLCWCT